MQPMRSTVGIGTEPQLEWIHLFVPEAQTVYCGTCTTDDQWLHVPQGRNDRRRPMAFGRNSEVITEAWESIAICAP
eukprot:scaffold457_cov50-Attheya_sp.AAC.3